LFGHDNINGDDLYDKDETSTAQPSTVGGKRTGVTVSSQEQVTFDSPSSGKDVSFENPDALFDSPSSGKDVLFENHDAFSAAAEDEVSMPNVTSSNVVLPPFPCEIGKFWFILTYQYQR
jgi:hypothetical protein